MQTQKTLGARVRENESEYIAGKTTISKYVDFSLSENINKIDAYINSRHTSGDTDSMGREKPFFNIVTAAINIWYRATDIDRKNIKVKATKEADITAAFLATIALQQWMRKENFGIFLNEWGRTLARYGSAVTKFVDSGDKLYPLVIPWNRLIVDQVNFDDDIQIEVLEMTPAQLKAKKGYNQDIVDQLLDNLVARETLDKTKKDNKTNFIKVYEVHGEMPVSYLTGDMKDENKFTQQMHVLTFLAGKDSTTFDDYCLYKGREEKSPYMITHLIKEDGRTQAIGAVEHLFEAQWMQNHTVKAIKDQLDLSSKLIFQTSDGNFVGQNALSAIESGDILIHAVNQPLTQVANSSHDIGSLQSFGQQWKVLANEIVGVSESMMGNAAPSGTAWRQVEALLQESHSLFELMTESKGLQLEEMMKTYVLPHLKKQLNNTDEISAILDSYQLTKIDSKYIPKEANKRLARKLIDTILNTGEVPSVTEQDKQFHMDEVTKELNEQGNQRFFSPDEAGEKTWNEVLKDLEWNLEVDVTGEQTDNKADMATLATVFQTISNNPEILKNQQGKMLFNKILLKTGTVSPIELADSTPQSSNQPLSKEVADDGGLQKLQG